MVAKVINYFNRVQQSFMAQVIGSQDKAEAALLEVCTDDATAQMLYSLGLQLGIGSWQEHWLQRSTISSPELITNHDSPSGTGDAYLLSPTQQLAHDTADKHTSQTHFNSILHSSLAIAESAAPDISSLQDDSKATDSGTSDSDQHDSAELSQQTLECQQIISHIRQTEFGMDVELDAADAELRQKQNGRLGRALHGLSQDLYSKDVHFVLELVQNADDNAYEPEVCPAVEFILEETRITIANNEVCFSPHCTLNNFALCLHSLMPPHASSSNGLC